MSAAYFAILTPHATTALVFPASIDGMTDLLPLMRAEKAEFEAVLGTEVTFVDEPPAHGPSWRVEIDPALPHNALTFDRATLTLTSRVRDIDGFMTSLNLLHALAARRVDAITDAPAATLPEAAARVAVEVGGSFPGFGIRHTSWETICARHDMPRESDLSFADVERWIADLDDAHTAIRRPGGAYNPPYVVEMTPRAATFRRVPADSAAFAAGVRSGWTLDDVDGADWLSRTGAPPHAKPWTTGRRAIALNDVPERAFSATGPVGEAASWVERPVAPTLERVFSWTALDGRTGYLRLANWFTGIGLEDAFDAALTELRGCERLVLDLQGNTGGNLVLATQTRDRFLRERTRLGSIQFSTGDGRLADPVPMWAEPSADHVRWDGELIVLTDPLTYSASEDFLLGLQGLPHVTVIGQRSGGGSGRPRTVTLTDDMLITISTALTFDRNGVCVENHGVPVDIETAVFAGEANPALEGALRGV